MPKSHQIKQTQKMADDAAACCKHFAALGNVRLAAIHNDDAAFYAALASKMRIQAGLGI